MSGKEDEIATDIGQRVLQVLEQYSDAAPNVRISGLICALNIYASRMRLSRTELITSIELLYTIGTSVADTPQYTDIQKVRAVIEHIPLDRKLAVALELIEWLATDHSIDVGLLSDTIVTMLAGARKRRESNSLN